MACTSYRFNALAAVLALIVASAAVAQRASGGSFRDDISIVDRHSHIIVLSDESGQASIAIWPAMQGRVLTSTATGQDGRGFGWVNRELIASGRVQRHINAVGGEDRLWLGPEGGQFSIFFNQGEPFDLAHWYTPAPIDTEAFDLVRQTKTSVRLKKSFKLTNYSGTKFDVRIDREVRLLTAEEVWNHLGSATVSDVKIVGFESEDKLTNLSPASWSKDTGLLSLWVLGQFQATKHSTIILPIRNGASAQLGIPVTTDYFGPLPADRIAVGTDTIFFRADANYRSKLGLSPQRAKGVLGSYDAENHVLTIVQFTQPANAADYVNSAWKLQAQPYKGDVANCYNDGPPSPGAPQLGKFYEMESSSPAVELASHASVEHIQRTMHLVGNEAALDKIAQAVLGVRLTEVRSFNP